MNRSHPLVCGAHIDSYSGKKLAAMLLLSSAYVSQISRLAQANDLPEVLSETAIHAASEVTTTFEALNVDISHCKLYPQNMPLVSQFLVGYTMFRPIQPHQASRVYLVHEQKMN